MKRENAFRAFLIRNSKSEAYINYCENVEKAFGGMDMDDIICSHQNISKARAKLEAMFPKKSSVDNYMAGLNRYLEFSVSAHTSAVVSATTPATPALYHVARAEGVPLSNDVILVAQTLEQEYAHIVTFAKDLLQQGRFDYIPVILSDETPMQDSPDGGEKILGRFYASKTPYIEIYYRNGDPHRPAQFRNVLAHEYWHYLHYVHAGSAFASTQKELKEALADFFGVLYSVHRHGKDDLAVAKARHFRWEKLLGTYWPYAYALYFYIVHGNEMKFSPNYSDYEKHGSVEKLVQIFFTTKHPLAAFDALTNT